MIILSALGGVMSVPIGHTGNVLKGIPGIPFGSSQALSGLHVLWLVLSAMIVRKTGSGTMTGALKGLVELFLGSFHGIFVFLISLIEGVVVDIVFAAANGRNNTISAFLAGGLSSASNVAVTQFLIIPNLPGAVLAYMYLVSFISGSLFTGYLGKRVLEIVHSITIR